MSLYLHSSKGNHQLLKDHLDKKFESTHSCSQALIEAAQGGHVQCVELLIPKSSSYAHALVEAARNGHAQCVGLLIPFVQGDKILGEALKHASKEGHNECVKLLISKSDQESIKKAVLSVAQEGYAACLQELILVVDFDVKKKALLDSATFGHAKNIKALIPFFDDISHFNDALFDAAFQKRRACMDLLIPLNDCQLVIHRLMNLGLLEQLETLQTRISLYEKTLLNNNILSSNKSRSNKKI